MSDTSTDTVRDGKYLFYGTLIAVIIAQLIFTLSSRGQIRYEELAESVRNVFWLQNHTLYDGVSSNIGWYGSLLFIYKIFGFELNSAKFFRLFLQILALISTALILRRYLSYKQSVIPLVAIGLSPTILYITTMQHSHGIDLQYAPIILYMILSLNKNGNLAFIFKSILMWAIAMLAWMSYPTFIFYLLPLAILYLWELKKISSDMNTVFFSMLAGAVGFFMTLAIGLSFLKDVQLAIYDNTTKSGIFRGAGAFQFNFNAFFKNLTGTFSDLFYKGQSYHFELPQADFSNYYPALCVLLIFGLGFSMIKNHKFRIYLSATFLLIFSNLIISSFTFDPSFQTGIRRTTGVLFGIYTLYALSWGYVLKHNFNNKNTRLILVIILILIPAHNLFVYPENFVSLSTHSIFAENQWFNLANTPTQSLDIMVKAVTKDELKLGCKDPSGKYFIACRYSEAYAATAGYCEWNNLGCHIVSGYDIQSRQQIPLSVDLWETYQIQH